MNAKKLYHENQDDAEVLSCLAWALLENGNPIEALEFADLAVKLNDFDSLPRSYRGYLLLRMGIYDGALPDLEQAIAQDASTPSWTYLNKARALAGLGRYFESLEELGKCNNDLEEPDASLVNSLKHWVKICLGFSGNGLRYHLNNNSSLINEAQLAYQHREYWFSLWASEIIITKDFPSYEQKAAKLIKLQSLIALFRTMHAENFADLIRDEFSDDMQFRSILKKLNKINSLHTAEHIDYNTFIPPSNDARKNGKDNLLFSVRHAKTYDLIENIRSGKRTYLLQFNVETIRYIGVEVVFDNPYYEDRRADFQGKTMWFLNDIKVGEHHFNFSLEKNWKTVEFVQSWGMDTPGFWNSGNGRVDIYLDKIKICSQNFSIGKSEILDLERNQEDPAEQKYLEKPYTEQPGQVKRQSELIHEQTLEELLDELNSYTGLLSVKQSINDFIAHLKFINERKKLGLKAQESFPLNLVFLGNPGTGKTTIARLLGKIFKSLGILKNGHIIEVDRSGLVGQYIGETAQKTDKVITEAMGGLLFIDEAYALKKEGGGQDFGQEAIDTLLKRMEDNNGEFAVIAAGYPDPMNKFLLSNPGLKSRFTHFFNFEDYSPEELEEIISSMAVKEDYNISDNALEVLNKEFTRLYRLRDATFGNARLVRNLFNEAKLQLGKRYLSLPPAERKKETMTTILAEDISAVLAKSSYQEAKIGIDEEALEKALQKIEKLTGLQTVKKETFELVKLARYHHEQGDNLREKLSSHFLFLGNPGTGKTTVARLFGEIYSALGILPKGHLIETDRQALVGSYVGQTAEKTKNVIDKAIGGTLFIDEAYTLTKKGDASGSDFGKEAIETLLKRMEDDRGKFIVIAAGYTNEMNHFIDSNPGLQSRFTKKIIFEDYSPDELMQIAEQLLQDRSNILQDDAKTELASYFNEIYQKRDKSFGNARLVRNLIEQISKKHLLRIADLPPDERTADVLKHITLTDIKDLIISKKDNAPSTGNENLLDSYLSELNELAGLDSVKHSVEKLVNSLKVARLRKERGLQVISKNLNAVFMGNPGTGKTAVAGLLSNIYREMGLLEKGHLIETDRTSLVAAYHGETSVKTDSVIQKALGGILFIDEAYLLTKNLNGLGQEALDTILRRMEEFRENLVVIISGDKNEMKQFLDNNPVIQSYFPNSFLFDDYQPRELLEIALDMSSKNGYILDEGAWQLFLEICTEIYNNRGNNFSNARVVRSLLYKAISNQEERILNLPEVKDDDLVTITLEDVSKIDYHNFI